MTARRVAPERIEVVDEVVARVLRAKSGMERLGLAHEAWELARDRLTAYFTARHPDLGREGIARLVARRLADDAG
jgi:hypothetical protein